MAQQSFPASVFYCLMSDDGGTVRNSENIGANFVQGQDSARVFRWLELGSVLRFESFGSAREDAKHASSLGRPVQIHTLLTPQTCMRTDLESDLRLGYVQLTRPSFTMHSSTRNCTRAQDTCPPRSGRRCQGYDDQDQLRNSDYDVTSKFPYATASKVDVLNCVAGLGLRFQSGESKLTLKA